MLTKNQIIDRIATLLERKARNEMSFQDLQNVLSNAKPGQQNRLLLQMRQGSAHAIGAVILKMVQDHVKAQVQAEAEGMLTDDALNLTELDRILS